MSRDEVVADLYGRLARLEAENESLRGSLEEWRLDLKPTVEALARLRAAEQRGAARATAAVVAWLRLDPLHGGPNVPSREYLAARIEALDHLPDGSKEAGRT